MTPSRRPGRLSIALLFVVGVVGATAASAEPSGVPRPMLSFRGRLAGAGAPASVSLGFSLYDAPRKGRRVWSQEAFVVPVVDGVYSATLGEPPAPALPLERIQAGDLWLEVTVDGAAAGPRRAVRQVGGATTIDGNLPAALGPNDDKRTRRFRHFYLQRAYPLETTPPGALQRARGQLARMRPAGTAVTSAATVSFGPASSGSWTFIGPQPVNGGQLVGPIRGPVSGRISALAIDPSDPNIVYLGGAQGGVWKSFDAGGTWVPLTDTLPSLAMGAIAIAPSNTRVLFAATGEAHGSLDSYYGAGVFKSVNGGLSWAATGPISASWISRVVVHPTNPDVVWVAGFRVQSGGMTFDSGVWKSIDGGGTWTRTLTGSASDLVIHPSNPAILYAALGFLGGSAGNGVYRSQDGGDTWTRMTVSGSGFPQADVGRINVDISRSSPSVLYASVQKPSDYQLLGIYRSGDAGATWSLVMNGGGVAHCAQQCWYDMYVAVAPNDPDTLYFGGLGLYRSTDGGDSFTDLSMGGGLGGLHVDQHHFAFHPTVPTTLYVANDGGAWKTTDQGATWINLNATLALTQFQSAAGHPTDPDIAYGGTQDNGTNKYVGSAAWQHVRDGDGGATLVDHANPQTVYHTFYNVSFERSDNGGGSWLTRTTGLNNERSLFYPPVEMDPSDPNVLYFGTYRVYRTANRADSWSPISPDLTKGGGSVSAIGPAKSSPQTVYAGTSDGHVQRTINGGASWVNLTKSPLPNRYVTSVVTDPANADVAWVTYSGFNTSTPATPGHVFRTTNGGASWQDMSGALPDIPINALALDPGSSATIYLASDLGVLVSTTGGAAWSAFDAGLPNVAVLDLSIPGATKVIYAATHGRSMYARAACSSPGAADGDGDGVADACDNCPAVSNAAQTDGDADGAGAVCDCDDASASVRPGIPEVCDGLDTDCDPLTPECPPICGDGATDAGEQCDDGNQASGDGCSSACATEFCGDGITQPGIGEECDDGNTLPEDGCSSGCLDECGDGALQGTEQCDDGNRDGFDGCSPACLLEVCGDGVLHQNLHEICDDGNTVQNDFCTVTCGRNVARDAFVTSIAAPARLAMTRRTDAGSQPIGPTGVILEDLAFGPSGVLFGVTDTGSLLTVDPATGASAVIGSTGQPTMKAIDVAPGGALYGIVTGGSGNSHLVSVDTTTAAVTMVGDTGFQNIQAIAFDATGTLHGAALDSAQSFTMVTIDTSTGLATSLGPFEFAPAGLDFHNDGTLYGVTGGTTGMLLRINLVTGVVIQLGNTGLGALSGIRFAPGGCPIAPGAEVCDGADNDCDGAVDDGFAPPAEIAGSVVLPDDVTLSWDPVAGASGYNVYRGLIAPTAAFIYDHPCLAAGLPAPPATDTASPAAGEALYYLVSGAFCAGEGPLGVASDGTPRPNASPCR